MEVFRLLRRASMPLVHATIVLPNAPSLSRQNRSQTLQKRQRNSSKCTLCLFQAGPQFSEHTSHQVASHFPKNVTLQYHTPEWPRCVSCQESDKSFEAEQSTKRTHIKGNTSLMHQFWDQCNESEKCGMQ